MNYVITKILYLSNFIHNLKICNLFISIEKKTRKCEDVYCSFVVF